MSIDAIAKKFKPAHDPIAAARYIGAVGHPKRKDDERSRLVFLGLKTAQVDELYRHIQKENAHFTFSDWEKLWKKSRIFEVKTLALAYLSILKKKTPLEMKSLSKSLRTWVTEIDNWAHSDGYSSILAHLNELDPKFWNPVFDKWSQSKNPWERRQSLVSLFYYASQRKKQPEKAMVFRHLKRLVDDPHFYVQRGVGWTLREAYQVYPEEQLKFVRAHIHQIPAAGWTATTEKYPPKVKKEFALLRRAKKVETSASRRKD